MVGMTPATKTEEFTNRVNAMWERLVVDNNPPDELEWRRLFRELEKAEAAPEAAPDMLCLQAILWALKQDIGNVNRVFNIYAGRYGKTRTWYMARASIGPLLGRPSMVIDMLDYDYPYGDRDGLFTIMNASAQIGLFLSARKAIRDLEALGENGLNDKAYIGIPTTLAAAEYLEEHGIDEREVAKRIQVAAETVKKYARISRFTLVANDFGIMLEYVVDADMDTLVDIDFEITDALCVAFEDPLSKHVSLGVTPPAGGA